MQWVNVSQYIKIKYKNKTWVATNGQYEIAHAYQVDVRLNFWQLRLVVATSVDFIHLDQYFLKMKQTIESRSKFDCQANHLRSHAMSNAADLDVLDVHWQLSLILHFELSGILLQVYPAEISSRLICGQI